MLREKGEKKLKIDSDLLTSATWYLRYRSGQTDR